ncbi:hypothetical protein ACGFNP_42080 [Nonomuraea sp. NPDC049269]|uniref:hypothetical protein n=1 Tax=Nonomuraea sp. NPDC049269 TaxID=3364349 RepID=UPI003711910C
MGNPTTDLRFTPALAFDIRQVLERHGYRLPESSPHLQTLVLTRSMRALRHLVEIYEGRTA